MEKPPKNPQKQRIFLKNYEKNDKIRKNLLASA
jgi:hypothetical protein